MDEHLINLLETNYFTANELEIINIINKKCSEDTIISLQALLDEIDSALNSDYIKKQESQFNKIENDSSHIINGINETVTLLENVKESGDNMSKKFKIIADNIEFRIGEIINLEKQYKMLEERERQLEIISAIQSSLILDDFELTCENLVHLVSCFQFSSEPKSSKEKWIMKKLLSYHQIISCELKRRFEECLKEIHWPFITNTLQRTTAELDLEKIQSASNNISSIFQQLYSIELPEHLYSFGFDRMELINTQFMPDFHLDKISIPIQLLLAPLIKYFKFFFWTDSKVNKISKPEWYMSQVIQWIMAHFSVLDELFTESILEVVNFKMEFVRGLVIMVMEKIQKDFELISTNSNKNDDLFFHLVEESLTMTMDLRKNFDYPKSYPDPVDVICNNNEIFDFWMKLEHRYASKQLDEVFRSPGSWQALSKGCKRVECLNSFIGLISAIKERIQCIYDISKQARFCEVLLEILDDFRRRLLQINKDYNANSQRWYDIMNVLYNVKILLRNWRLEQIFIGIHKYNNTNNVSLRESKEVISDSQTSRQLNQSSFTISSLYSNRTRVLENIKLSTDSVFSTVLSLYQHVLEEMEENCISSAFDDISERSDAYIKKSWLEIGPPVTARLMSLSSQASGMLLVLRDRLHGLESALEQELFEHVWQGLAIKFNKMIFESVIRSHRFNGLGASQLDFDITKNILPLFLPYTKTPERFFVKCLEAAILLNLQCGTAILIKKILETSLHSNETGINFSRSRPDCPIRTLTEIGISTLLPEDAEFILNLRTDINLDNN